MPQPKHEIEAAANTTANELSYGSPFMKGLSAMVWGNNPPYSQPSSTQDSEDMFAAMMQSPQGYMTVAQRWGPQKAAEIQQELVKNGRLLPPPQQQMTEGQ